MVAVSVKLYTARIITGRYINNNTMPSQADLIVFFIIRLSPVLSPLH